MVKFNNISLRYKLILGFLLIAVVNGITGAFELKVIKDLGGLVRQTYDQALMSGTFALASKYDYAQYNLDVQAGLLAETSEEFEVAKKKARRMQRTLKEDLEVFKERSLDLMNSQKIVEILNKVDQVEESRVKLFEKKSLGLNSKQAAIQSGELIREWNSAPEGQELYRSLTSMYDDAAELGYKFRLDSDERISKATKLTLTVLGICLFLSVSLSIGLSVIIIKPLSKLKAICLQIAGGNFSIRSEISGTDEFGTLSSVFNLMLGNIDEKTQSMSSLLNTIPFALFYFDKEGNISTERSFSTDKLLPDFSQHKKIEDFFAGFKIPAEDVHGIRQAMFENAIPFSSASYLLPQMLTIGEGSSQKLIKLSYHQKRGPNKKLLQVIILGEDITEKERANARTRELTERVERVTKVSADMAGFKEFTAGVESLTQSLKQNIARESVEFRQDILRDLHSLKGLLGVYSFETVARLIHDLETRTLENPALPIQMEPIFSLYDQQRQDLDEILALSAEDNLTYLDHKKIFHLKEQVLATGDLRLTKLVRELDRFPFTKVFAKFSSYAVNVAKKLEDKQIEVVLEDSDDVSFEEIKRIDPVLIHVLNNSVDHGIEASEERISAQKSEVGKISVMCKRNQDASLTVKISDDGRGINGDLLFEKAVRVGIVAPDTTMNPTEKMNLVFAAGLSSKSESSIFSGRGVGMDAVKSHIESLGGSIRLESKIGVGTTFELSVPSGV